MAAAGAIAQAVSGGYRGALGLREAVRRAFFGRSGVGLLVSPPWRLTLKRVSRRRFAPVSGGANSDGPGLQRASTHSSVPCSFLAALRIRVRCMRHAWTTSSFTSTARARSASLSAASPTTRASTLPSVFRPPTRSMDLLITGCWPAQSATPSSAALLHWLLSLVKIARLQPLRQVVRPTRYASSLPR